MSETMNGAELARLILRRGTTAAQIVEMDVEALTETVAYRRKRKVAPGAIDPALTDEQLARAILEYAQSEPVDWPVPLRPATSPETGRSLPILAAGAVGSVLLTIVGVLLGDAIAEPYLPSWSLFEPLIGWGIGALVGSPIGAWLGVSIAGAVLGREPRPWPIIILATAVGLGVGGPLSFWILVNR